MLQNRNRNSSDQSNCGVPARCLALNSYTAVAVESLETRALFSAGGDTVRSETASAFWNQPSMTFAAENSKFRESIAALTAESDPVVFFASRSVEFARDPQLFGRMDLAIDRPRGEEGGLIGHFSPGEGTGAPLGDDFSHFHSEWASASTFGGAEKFASVNEAHDSVEEEIAEHAMQFRTEQIVIVISGGNYHPFEDITIAGPRLPTGAVVGYSSLRSQIPPVEINQQKFLPGEGRAGEVTVSRIAQNSFAPPQIKGTQPIMADSQGDTVIRTLLKPAMIQARTLAQAATRVTDAARISTSVFATTVIADSDHDTGGGVMLPVAMIRATTPFLPSGMSDVSGGYAVVSQSSGAINVAQALLRFMRSLAAPAQTVDVPGDAELPVPQHQGGWDAPMFMSANLLGLAPGSPWISAVNNSGQQTLRWVAGVSLLITVAGCWYCAATTARARRAALDEALQSTIRVQL